MKRIGPLAAFLLAAVACHDAPTTAPMVLAPNTASLFSNLTIDVVPGDESNSVHAGTAAVQVILFATATEGVADLDVGRTTFGGVVTHFATLEDKNGDGFLDMTMFFRTAEMALPLGTSTVCLETYFQSSTLHVQLCSNVTLLPDTEAPTVVVVAPQAKDHVDGGAGFYVMWHANDDVGSVSHVIAVSLDGGSTFATVATGAMPNVVPYVNFVTIPDTKAKEAIIRVSSSDAAGNTGHGLSATFKLKQKGK